MSISPLSTYIADNLYYRANGLFAPTTTASGESASQTKGTESTSGDRVTFSADLSIARTREAMGLNPTGKLKFKDLEAVVEDRKEFVSSTLAQTMESLGLEPDREIRLSMDSEDKIRIAGDFSGKSKLEEALNENEEFTTAFKQLSANQSILDYTSQLQRNVHSSMVSALDYFDSEKDSNALLSLAAQYQRMKSGGNNMQTLLELSSSRNPYTYAYAPDDKTQ